MVCIHCGSKTQVINSRSQLRTNHVWRRRRCSKCASIFSTIEAPDYATGWAVKTRSGDLEAFKRDKLFLSLYDSCQHRKTPINDAGALTDTVIKKLRPLLHNATIETRLISQTAQVALSRFDAAASVRYAAFHH